MDWFPLPLFPEGGLSASVIVTVWIGVFVVCTANLRLGWVLSGLVIPGYMVPLLIAKPMVALVTFAEGVAAYVVVWFYSEYLSRHTGWSNFFGRDRFFALVLVSVGIRIAMDGWLLPELGEWLLREYRVAYDYRSNLHSFGLIVTALIANNFWKTGVWRGLLPMFVQVGLTWLIVRYGLMEFTNFNVASLQFMYEDIALSFLAAPKAYIILLVTAFIASRLNLLYGWDFSGILIPSLLALTWYEPLKIVTTMVEAVIILAASQLVLALPVFRNITMEGARKLLLFFNVSFAYKYLLSWALVLFLPQVKISDWFGFGYLLATLIALKIHDKGNFARMTRATLQTSLTGLAVATVVGFVLLLLPDRRFADAAQAKAAVRTPLKQEHQAMTDVLYESKTSFYAASIGRHITVPLEREIDAFAAGVRRLLEYRKSHDPQTLTAARGLLDAVNYDVELVEDAYLLRERAPQRYWGTYALRLNDDSRLLVEVPAPVDETGSFEAGVALFVEFKAGAFASAGASRKANDDGAADVLMTPRTIFQAFHRELASRQVLQVRRASEGGSTLYAGRTVPQGLALSRLEQVIGKLQVRFATTPGRNLQRETMTGQFSELWLAPDDLGRVQAASRLRTVVNKEHLAHEVSAALLADVTPQHVAQPGSRAYRAPLTEELLQLDRETLAPLFELAAGGRHDDDDSAMASRLAALAANADPLGLQLRWVADARGEYFWLHDSRHFRGWLLIRRGEATNLIVEVPRPLTEPGTLETALSVFADLKARALIVAGAAPDANPDASADVLLVNNAGSLFNLAHQAALRRMADAAGTALLVRALAVRPDQHAPREDAILSFDTVNASAPVSGAPTTSATLAAALVHSLESMGMSIRVGGGDVDTAGLEAQGGPLASYMTQTRNKHFAVLWVSPIARRQLDTDTMQAQGLQFAALGLPVRTSNIMVELKQRRFGATALPDDVRKLAEQYQGSGDIVQLTALKQHIAPLHLERVEDGSGRGAYLLALAPDGSLAAVLALSVRSASAQHQLTVKPGPVAAEDAERFVSSRALWMEAR